MKKIVKLELTIDQAKVVEDALDLYSRIGIGQLEEVEHVLKRKFGFFNVVDKNTPINWDAFNQAIKYAKLYIGFEPNASYGIGNKKVSVSVKRAFEIQKTLSKELAMDRDPNPGFKTFDYEGLTSRYTDDPAPECTITKIK